MPIVTSDFVVWMPVVTSRPIWRLSEKIPKFAAQKLLERIMIVKFRRKGTGGSFPPVVRRT